MSVYFWGLSLRVSSARQENILGGITGGFFLPPLERVKCIMTHVAMIAD